MLKLTFMFDLSEYVINKIPAKPRNKQI